MRQSVLRTLIQPKDEIKMFRIKKPKIKKLYHLQ